MKRSVSFRGKIEHNNRRSTVNKPLCIFHSNCLDGFTAAWVVRRHFASHTTPIEADFHAANYGEAPPDVTGRQVIIVDFSYPREVLLEMGKQASSVTVIDHHKTAAAALEFPPPNVVTYFDMERSGARLTWDFYFPGETPPDIVRFVEDRDLWRFKYPGTRAYCQLLGSLDMTFEEWDDIAGDAANAVIIVGEQLLRQHDKHVQTCLRMAERPMTIGGVTVPTANVPVMYASDAGNMMAKGAPFSATYVDTLHSRVFSLRSTDAGLDVSDVAKRYGGGGHRNAAGFKVPRDHELARA